MANHVRLSRAFFLTICSCTLFLTLSLRQSANRDFETRVAQLHKAKKRQRIAIVQYIGDGGSQSAGFASARSVMWRYAKRHGYALYTYEYKNVSVREPDFQELELFGFTKHHWRKPFYLSELIRQGNHEWLAYFDTDIVITNPAIPLEEFIDADDNNSTDMVIADDPSGICNGVFFQKATEWTLWFNELWWQERQISHAGHDNWPFMAALLKAWALSNNHEYQDECSMAKHREMEDWGTFLPCYRNQLDAMGGRTTHPDGCTDDYPAPCGSALPGDSHIRAVWELNKGLGFGGKNAYSAGSFLIHFAGHSGRNELMAQYSSDTFANWGADS